MTDGIPLSRERLSIPIDEIRSVFVNAIINIDNCECADVYLSRADTHRINNECRCI